MTLKFTKWEAAGNDLILVDCRTSPLPESAPQLAMRLCDRHFGIGSDGLLTLERGEGGLALLRMHNPDGSEDFCGNGLRCAAAWLRHAREIPGREAIVLTPRGRHAAVVEPVDAARYDVEVETLEPRFAPEEVPVRMEHPAAGGGAHRSRVLRFPLNIDGDTFEISCVNTGSTHTVIWCDEEPDDTLFRRVSPLIETHPLFPKRTNVLWCRGAGGRVRVRVWERAVGETLSCGSGACAVAAIGRELGRTDPRVAVVMRGGTLSAAWNGCGPVRLAGPVRLVYAGETNGSGAFVLEDANKGS